MAGKAPEEPDLRIEPCLERAAQCERQAAAAHDPAAKGTFIDAANSWCGLADAFAQLYSIHPAEP